jgi:DNA-binding CsgD family transcriptional regulator
MRLHGRDAELALIDDLLGRARDGDSGVLVLRGDPGIGKSALLAVAAGRAGDFRVMRAAGIEEESELPYAGLQLLLRPALDGLGALPDVQADALRGALGLAPAGTPDRFLVGLAVLSLLAEAAASAPLLCLVDDAQWLDPASADALAFAARRLAAESVVVLFAARLGGFAAAGLPARELPGLSAAAAAALLGDALPPARRYRVLAEAGGNPLALLELPRVAGDGAGPGPLPLTDRLRDAFQGQLYGLPAATRVILLVAVAEGTGELAPVLRAAASLGAGLADLDPAVTAGLIGLDDGTLTFRHTLIRAAVQHAALPGQRRAAHQALADALDGPGQADRRAWQRALAAPGPDEEVARALEQTAGGARARSGETSALAWYERAAALSTDPAAKTRRLSLASAAAAAAGDLGRAAALAAEGLRLAGLVDVAPDATGSNGMATGGLVTGGPVADAAVTARLLEAEATVAFLRGQPGTAQRRLLRASALAGDREAVPLLIEAVHAGWYAGQEELAESVAALERRDLSAAPLARLLLAAVAPVLGRPDSAADPAEAFARARAAAAGNVSEQVLVCGVGLILGHDAATREVGAELSQQLRAGGQIGWLPSVLFYAASAQAYGGRPDEARATVDEALTLARDTGQQRWADALAEPLALVAAVGGDEQRCREVTDAALAGADRPAWSVPWTSAALGLLDLGHGRAESALARLEALAEGRRFFHIPATRSTPDLVEAAVRAGRPEAAAEALTLFETWARSSGQPWTTAVAHRCRALTDGGEHHFQAALDLHQRDHRPFDEARTRLLYGEWLRRDKRKADARVQLGAALETFRRIGAAPWADRASGELTATGTAVRPAEPGLAGQLTPQELQIVRLAARGLSNKEIAAQLFLSPRTVGHHLYKAYPKLGVLSRAELPGLDLG